MGESLFRHPLPVFPIASRNMRPLSSPLHPWRCDPFKPIFFLEIFPPINPYHSPNPNLLSVSVLIWLFYQTLYLTLGQVQPQKVTLERVLRDPPRTRSFVHFPLNTVTFPEFPIFHFNFPWDKAYPLFPDSIPPKAFPLLTLLFLPFLYLIMGPKVV